MAKEIDLVVKNGMIVTPDGLSEGAVDINHGKIVAIAREESCPPAKKP